MEQQQQDPDPEPPAPSVSAAARRAHRPAATRRAAVPPHQPDCGDESTLQHQVHKHEGLVLQDESALRIEQTIDDVIGSVMQAHWSSVQQSSSSSQHYAPANARRRAPRETTHNDSHSDDTHSDDQSGEEDDELLDVGDSFMNCSAPDMTAMDGKLYGPDGRRKYKKIMVEDQHLIRALRRDDGLGAVTIAKILKGRVTVSAVKAFIRKLVATDQMHSRDAIKRKSGSGRPRRARTPDKIDKVRAMIEQPEDMGARPGVTHISRQLGISRRAVYQIMKKDLKMKPTLVQAADAQHHGTASYSVRFPAEQAISVRECPTRPHRQQLPHYVLPHHNQSSQLLYQQQRRAKRITRVVRHNAGSSGILSVVDSAAQENMLADTYETVESGQMWVDEHGRLIIDGQAPPIQHTYTYDSGGEVQHEQRRQTRHQPIKVGYVNVDGPMDPSSCAEEPISVDAGVDDDMDQPAKVD